jgi:hypothetical protein
VATLASSSSSNKISAYSYRGGAATWASSSSSSKIAAYHDRETEGRGYLGFLQLSFKKQASPVKKMLAGIFCFF